MLYAAAYTNVYLIMGQIPDENNKFLKAYQEGKISVAG
jgi:hypothetical protein